MMPHHPILATAFALILALSTQDLHSALPLEETKTSDTEFDIAKEVTAFSTALVRDQPEVSAQYARLIAAENKSQTEGNLDPQLRPLDSVTALEWTVDAFAHHKSHLDDRQTFLTDASYTYLTFQQLFSPTSGGYQAKKNIIAKFKVTYHSTALFPRDDNDHSDPKLLTNTLTITFQGFVDVSFQALK